MTQAKFMTAVYPGTFDPMTLGHEDLMARSSRLFDKLILAIAESPSKQPRFPLADRVAMAHESLGDLKNIEIVGFNTLLMDFVHEKGAKVVVRGLRAVSDFEYEFQFAHMNRRLAPDIDTTFFMTDERNHYVSSSLVKEVAGLGETLATGTQRPSPSIRPQPSFG